jgi:hypothetical protein
MCLLKKYSALFGNPGKGLHSTHFMGVALIDVLFTVLAALLTSYYTDIPITLSLMAWLVFGLLAHWLFGVETSVMRYLNLTC